MKRKIFRILLFVFLVYLPIQFIYDQFSMRDELSTTIEKFETTVNYHKTNGIEFEGEIDSILVERNEILRQNEFLKIGNWSTNSFFRTELTVYLNASWLPVDIQNMMAKVFLGNSPTIGESLFSLLFFIFPIVLYMIGWASVINFLRKPAH